METGVFEVVGMSCDCSSRKVARVLKTIRGGVAINALMLKRTKLAGIRHSKAAA